MIRSTLLIVLLVLLTGILTAQDALKKEVPQIQRFGDSSRHWYRIFDDERVIEPAEDQQRYPAEEYIKIADNILLFQKQNGGWPQFYPDTSGYHKYITFNDNAMIGIMQLLQNIVHNDANYQFVDRETAAVAKKAYQKGIDCIIRCQIFDLGQKTAWCQQHDNIDLRPRDARTFEKASICNGESAAIVKFLMQVRNPDTLVIEAVEKAITWFKDSQINGIRVQTIESTEAKFIYHKTKFDKIVVEDPDAPRIWARFYELGTHRPIFCGRNGKVYYSMAEIDRDRRTGYGWYHYAPEETFTLYDQWKNKLSLD